VPFPFRSNQEDALVRKLVGELGVKKWSQIASQLEGRLGKQCRERCVPRAASVNGMHSCTS
jgi:hypothetical protein